MEEKNANQKPPVTIREIITDYAISGFFGTYMVYIWLGTDSSKADISAAFGVPVYAVIKALILLLSMTMALLGGYRLFKILIKLKKSVKFIDTDD